MEVLGPFLFLVIALALALIVAWIVLPLAVIGTKPLLREILDEMRRQNRLLAKLP